MKQKVSPIIRIAVLAACSIGLVATSARAGIYVKADNATALNVAGAWVNNAVPGANDIAQWDSTVTALNTTNILGGNLTLGGIAILNPAGAITLATNASGGNLTLGAAGFDLSAATVDLTLSNNLVLPDYTVQAWNIPAGRTLSLGGAFTRTGGSALSFNGNGTVNIASGTASSLLAYALVNGTDVGALDASKNLSTVAAVITYISNPATGVPSSQYMDMTSPIGATGNDWYNSGTTTYYPRALRFNMPQGSRNYWQLFGHNLILLNGNSGANTILVTTNVGACDVILTGDGSAGASIGMRQTSSGSEFIFDQENTLGSLYINLGFSVKTASLTSNMVTKRGAGRLVVNTDLWYAGPTRILEGEFQLNGANRDNSVIIVNRGATLSGNAVIWNGSLTNSGTLWPGNGGAGSMTVSNSLTLNAGSSLKFYNSTVPTTNTSAPLSVMGSLTVGGTVQVAIQSGQAAVGQYPLVKWTNNLTAVFANFTLASLPLHVQGYLSNNTTTASIDLVITNITEPLRWATGNGTWNTNGGNLWLDAQGNATSYQETGGLADSVLFEDSVSGGSPITVTLNNTLVPNATTVSNNTKTYTISGSGAIAGTGSFTKAGSGTLTLATANTFTGRFNLAGGAVNFSALNNLGAGPINFSGGTLKYNGNADDISARTVTIGAGGAAIDVGASSVTYNAPIGNNGAGGLTKLGSGTLTLTGTNNYAGNTVVAAGTLALNYNTYISNSAAIIVNSGATLDAASSGVGLTLAGNPGQILAGSGTVNGTIVCSNGVITPGTNGVYATLTFGNDFTIAGGSLVMDVSTTNHDLLAIGGSLTINGGSLLVINNSTPLTNGVYKLITYGGSLSGGSGSVGNLTVVYSQSGKAAALNADTTGEIDLVISDTANDALTWAGVGANWDAVGSLNWLRGAAAWAYTNGDAVTFDETGSAIPNVSLQGAVSPGSMIVSNNVTTYDFTDGTGSGGGKIAGGASIVKNGAGTLILETANVNTGALIISNGTVQVGNSGGGDLGAGNIINNGALVFAQGDGASHPVTGQISGPGSVTQQGSASTTVALAGNNSYAGPTTISSGILQVGNGGATGSVGTNTVTDNGTLAFNRTGSLSVPSVITGTGGLTVNGGGTITLAATNGYTGTTTVNNGKLVEGQAGSLGGQGALVVQAAGTNDLNGHDLTVTRLQGAGGRIVNNAGTGTNSLIITYAGSGTADSSIVIADNDGSGGKVQVVMNGSATQIIRSANTYSGGTVINSGALQARQANNAFGSGTNIILNGGMLDNYGSILAYSVTVTTNSSLYSAANCTFNGAFFGSSNLNVTLAGTVTSGNTMTWGAANQLAGYSGKFICNVDATTYGRFWRWGNTSGTVNGSSTAGWDLEGNVTMIAQNTGDTIYLGSLESASTLTSVNGNNTTYIVGGRNASTSYSGNVYGTGSFVKTGSGTLTLDSSYTFFGSTIVSNGVLALTGNAAATNSSTIAIRAGATLDVSGLVETFDGTTFTTDILNLSGDTTNQMLTGSGTVVGSVVASANSTINPGDGIGTLTVTTNVTLGGLLIMELNRTNAPATNDMLAAQTIIGGGVLTVTNLGPALQTGDTFKLFNHPVSGFATVNLPQTFVQNGATNSYVWQNNLAVDGSIQVTTGYNPVNPNPTNIVISVSGNTLTLSWPADHTGWTLQAQTNTLASGLTNNWVDVPGSTGVNSVNITADPSKPTVFYRLKL